MKGLIYKARIVLVNVGKVLPFLLCALIVISYAENAFALATNNFVIYDDAIILRKPISHFIGNFMEYNVQTWIGICIICIAIETCIYNKLACVYLGVNLFEKSYFDFELEPTTIYIICFANIIIAGCLTYKGIKIFLRHE